MYDPEKHNSKSPRLDGYDYSQNGYYFITICVRDRYHLFGKISDEQMWLNKYGEIARQEWDKTEKIRSNVQLDEFVIMPNHVHGIIVLTNSSDTARRVAAKRKFGNPTKGSIPTIVRSYKSAVTKRINKITGRPGEKIWQRNYHDHIIRNRNELNRIQNYIRNNPKNWSRDSLGNSRS